VGPGSFTGLRVGTSTVKGLAFVLQKPVVGVCTLDALALNVAHADPRTVLCPMVDAGRGEVYTALYRLSGPDTYEKTLQECVIALDEFLVTITGEIVFLGDGAQKYRILIGETLPDRSAFAPLRFNQVRAGAVGLVGRKRFYDGDKSDIMTLAPDYLRPSYAASTD
ncbi:MAG: tRNA (adenosine(37)-N6)-threonylcarbamoyltransferase complex dimerization subunit type 1 TsaB, partial [Deltaproteobacteria bacterium]|nr:tRNA (adenosine(37)-N6)-threonylcarbamoyltransferase complex dimerization subunit type 1 TsaB [Deltaproteobacteria bacterium]